MYEEDGGVKHGNIGIALNMNEWNTVVSNIDKINAIVEKL